MLILAYQKEGSCAVQTFSSFGLEGDELVVCHFCYSLIIQKRFGYSFSAPLELKTSLVRFFVVIVDRFHFLFGGVHTILLGVQGW
jgi:hypothetical protein